MNPPQPRESPGSGRGEEVNPSFVCPPPVTSQRTLDLELAALAATSPEAVRAALDERPGPRSPRLAELYADPPAVSPGSPR